MRHYFNPKVYRFLVAMIVVAFAFVVFPLSILRFWTALALIFLLLWLCSTRQP